MVHPHSNLVQLFDEDNNITLGALAGAAAIFGASKIDAGREQGFRIMKSRLFISMTGKTATEGPILLGVCANIPTAADLAGLLALNPQDISDNPERADNWFVKMLDQIGLETVSYPNNPMVLKTPSYSISYGRNGWSIPEGSALNYFAFNAGASLTTGTVFLIAAEHFGVWLRD